MLLSKGQTLGMMVAFAVFALPWVRMRFARGWRRRAEQSQWWSLACCGFSMAHLIATPLYIGLTDAEVATRADCYLQELVLFDGWAASTWFLYVFQYHKQRVVTMSLPHAVESKTSRFFGVVVTFYSPALMLGIPFWLSNATRDPRDGMCPWVLKSQFRFLFPLHAVVDTAISILSLFLFVRPLWDLSRRPSASAAAGARVKATALRNAAASLVAIFATVAHITGHCYGAGRQPGTFWLFETLDVTAKIVSCCLSYEWSESTAALVALASTSFRQSRTPRALRRAGEKPPPHSHHEAGVECYSKAGGDIAVANPMVPAAAPPPAMADSAAAPPLPPPPPPP